MTLKLGMKHQATELYKVYINHDPGMTLTFLRQGAFKGLISHPSEPTGEIMSFGVSPVNYSDSDSEGQQAAHAFEWEKIGKCQLMAKNLLGISKWTEY